MMARMPRQFGWVAALLLGCFAVAPVFAQPAPSASAKAAGAPGAGGLPSGHPPVGASPGRRDIPPGHEAMFAEPPEDDVADDPSLPAGTLVVQIKDGANQPLPKLPVRLTILKSSVAKGDSEREVQQITDESGSFRMDSLELGSGISYRINTSRGPAQYSLGPFGLSDQRGKRATLHAYEASTSIDGVMVGMQGAVYVALREDALVVEQLFSIFNLGEVAWVPTNIQIKLPEGFKAFTKQDMPGMTLNVAELSGIGATLKGTVPPGRHDVTFRYQVPLENEEKQTIRIEMPPRVAMARVMAEASRNMGLSVAGFPPAEQTKNREGKRLLMTGKQAPRDEGGVRKLEITISGLPTPGPGRWIAVGLTCSAFFGAAFFLSRRKGDQQIDEDALRELHEARDALLDEIAELTRAHQRGDVGPRTYGRVKNALMDSLARIVAMIEAAEAPVSKTVPKTASKASKPAPEPEDDQDDAEEAQPSAKAPPERPAKATKPAKSAKPVKSAKHQKSRKD